MLVFVRASRYDAGTGQFTQQDPIGIAGGANVYGFSGGDPVNLSDPFGLSACKDKDGKTIDCPAPEGAPPVPLPDGKNGEPNEWIEVPGSGVRQKWAPRYPVPSTNGGQPGGSWDPAGHWDVKDGVGGTRRYAPDGIEVTHDGDRVFGPQQFPTPSAQQVQAAGAVGGLALTIFIIRTALRIAVPATNLIPVP